MPFENAGRQEVEGFFEVVDSAERGSGSRTVGSAHVFALKNQPIAMAVNGRSGGAQTTLLLTRNTQAKSFSRHDPLELPHLRPAVVEGTGQTSLALPAASAGTAQEVLCS